MTDGVVVGMCAVPDECFAIPRQLRSVKPPLTQYNGAVTNEQETLAGAAAGTSAAAGAAGVVPPDPSATRRLTLVATNEYGTFDRQAAIMYELNMLIEPFRETKIAVVQSGRQHSGRSPSAPARYDWFLAQADASGRPLENTEPEVDSRGGSFSTVTLKQAGATYALVVRQLGGSDGKTVVAEGRTTITCKYVRRELRDLTQRDREAFFEAMLLFYTVPLDDGRRKYGEMWSNAQLVSAYHNSKVRSRSLLFALFLVHLACSSRWS